MLNLMRFGLKKEVVEMTGMHLVTRYLVENKLAVMVNQFGIVKYIISYNILYES